MEPSHNPTPKDSKMTTAQQDAARLMEIARRIEWLQHLLSRVEGLPTHDEAGNPLPVCGLIGAHNAEINRLKTERAAISYRRTHSAA
jgi:hypothetical protein